MWYCLLDRADLSLQPKYCIFFLKKTGSYYVASQMLGLNVCTPKPNYKKCITNCYVSKPQEALLCDF